MFRLGRYSLNSLCTVEISTDEFLVVVPVFNVKDAWDAAKIAHSKIQSIDASLVSCIPCRNDYICVFGSKVEPKTKFPVYRCSSEREARKD